MTAMRTTKMFRLKIIGVVAPLAFGITLGLFTEWVLHPWMSAGKAHLVATGLLIGGVIVFAYWMFSRLEDLQARLDVHRRRQAQQAAQMARMEERERIGLQLHDGVIQGIYGVQLRLDACIGDLEDERSVACLNGSIDELTEIIGRMRQYIFGLQPSLDNGVPLVRALSDLFQAAHANSTAETEFYAEEGALDRLSNEDAGALFQVANEGVASAISRGATHVKASVTGDGGSLCMQVNDNGSPAGESQFPHIEAERAAVKVVSHDGNNILTVSLPFAAARNRA